ncbi:MAG: hypothetical protein NXI27_14785 [Alphaproteobacteria bacterium]|nr:hypothetical protein [Alphaproteobacteria bacterium]
MRQEIVGWCLVLALIGSAGPVAAESCIACRYFEALETADESKDFTRSMSRLENRPLAMVSLNQGAFCDNGIGGTAADELTTAADRQFSQTQNVLRRSKECPQTCAPSVSEAEYCAYRDRLIENRYRLGAIALRLTDLAEIYERAGSEDRLPLEVLSADMTLYGGESLSVLADALEALVSGDPYRLPELRWQASSTEMSALFDAVALLVDFSLIEGDTQQLEMMLERAATQLSFLREQLTAALTGTGIMQAGERRPLEQAILDVGSNLAWAIASLQVSAESQRTSADMLRSRAASEDPAGPGPGSQSGAVACLKRLSSTAFNGSEAPGMTLDILSNCRPFTGCLSVDLDRTQSVVSPLRALLGSRVDIENRTSSLVKFMCAAN